PCVIVRQHSVETATRASHADWPAVKGKRSRASSGMDGAALARSLPPRQPSCIHTVPAGTLSVTSSRASNALQLVVNADRRAVGCAARGGVGRRDPRVSERAGRACGFLCRVVELNGHGPRHTVADVDSHVQDACNIVVHNLVQKVEERSGVKRFLLMLHDSPQATRTELACD